MNVAFVTHQLAYDLYGGLETQMINVYKELNNLGVHTKLFKTWEDKLDDYDIVHIFSPTMFPFESWFISWQTKERGMKVVTSTVFWEDVPRIIKAIRKKFFKAPFYHHPYKYVQKTLINSEILLPNTNAEALLVKEAFDVNTPIEVIPNGVELHFKDGDPELFTHKYNLEPDYVLFVGRIEKRKNVLNLIKAFVKAQLDTKLVIIGKVADASYFKKCEKYATNDVIFLPPLPHDSELLKSAYGGAKVFGLPSYVETPGIAALEAGLAGANIVITKIGGTIEYFRDYAWYVNPRDIESIREALIDAYYTAKSSKLSKHIEKNYNWRTIAKKYYDVYQRIL